MILFMMGASIFSFLNVVIYRLPLGMNWVNDRSMCPSCKHQLSFRDMIPIFSWLFLKGKCRYCGAPVSGRYTFVELLGGISALLCVSVFGFTLKAVLAFIFISLMTVITFIDIDHMIIPNKLVIAVLIFSLCSFSFFGVSIIEALIGALCVSLPMYLVTLVIPDGFGGGDIKLMGAAGIFLGWKLTLVATFIAIMTGGGYGLYLLVTKNADRKSHFAFGPFLCLGMVVALLCGNTLIRWYLGLFGL